MLRCGKPVAEKLENQMKQRVDQNNMINNYVAVMML